MILDFLSTFSYHPHPGHPRHPRQRPVSCCAKCEGFSILSKSGSSGSSSGSTWEVSRGIQKGETMGRLMKSGKIMEKVRLISMSFCGKHVGKWMEIETWAMNINLRQLETETGMISIVFLVLDIPGTILCIQLLDMTPFHWVLSPMLHFTA